MSKGWDYIAGDWWAICDVCGQKHKAQSMKHRWDGFMVCVDDFEQRHPQDFLKAKIDKIVVPWTRPRTTDTFIIVDYPIYVDDRYVVSGYTEDGV